MARTKGALGKKTLEKLEKLKTVKTITNTKIEEKPKRKRRTKAEMEEANRLEAEQKSSYWDNCPPMKTADDISDEQIQKAIERGDEDAYEDLRTDFERGDIAARIPRTFPLLVGRLFQHVTLLCGSWLNGEV